MADAALWRAQIDHLRDIAAPSVADLTLDDSVVTMAARALIAAPPRFSLVALSMGGYVAFEILRQAPERVERLALISTSASPDGPARAEQRRRGMESLALGRFVGVTARLLPQLIHPSRTAEPLGDAVRAMAGRVGSAAFLRQQQAILGRPDSRPLLGSIAMPTLIAVGDGDVLTPPAESALLHAGISGSRLHVIERCGHLPAMEQPDLVSALLRAWLSS